MLPFAQIFERQSRQRVIRFLCSADPEQLEAFGRTLLLPAFRRAASRVPAYRKLLAQRRVDPGSITTAEEFKSFVPLIDKHETFAAHGIEELCVGGTIDGMKLGMSSSWFSGVFSFGINTPRNYRDTAKSIDTALDYTFGISRKKTFLVNCIPMGVKVHTSLKLAETSVRPDMALAIIKKFSPKFDQTLVVSDPHFLKKLLEDGLEEGLNWKKMRVSLISGEDWFSESMRSYLGHLMDFDPDRPDGRLIGATMGIAELDLNLFHESAQTIALRRRAQNDQTLRQALFGPWSKVCPILFHYYPHRMFLEALPETGEDKELVFSMLSPHMLIPLIRYNSRDRGDIIPYNKMKKILADLKLGAMMPELRLPLVWVSGRKDRYMEAHGKKVYPEEIKQGLYEDFEVASKTTGYFRLNKEGGTLEVQLKKYVILSDDLRQRFTKALLKYSDADIPVIFYAYQDFPYGMELDYERKFNNI